MEEIIKKDKRSRLMGTLSVVLFTVIVIVILVILRVILK